MSFAKPWRPYQAEVLDQLDDMLEDSMFHLVSAPGSGKTVTGLEVLRRIGKPTLILAPTIAIREQWIERLIIDFLPTTEEPTWISRDVEYPAELTFLTYQALSSAFRKADGPDTVIAALKRAGVSTLVVDEAHHLRATWWQCMTAVRESLDQPTIVALTATPPIDVSASEWRRYSTFCGPVDIEVGVPELVAEKNLCPHQDFIHLSTPTGKDVEELQRYAQGVERFLLDLQLDISLAESLSTVDWPLDTQTLKAHHTFYLALVIYCQQVGGYIPLTLQDSLEVEGPELPDFDINWAETLLQGLLFDLYEYLQLCSDEINGQLSALKIRLHDLGAVEKKKVVLKTCEQNQKLLRDSTAKLQSIAEIIEHELAQQGVLLRSVVLTDYVRKDAFPTPGEIDAPMVKLGVVPIFERLRRSSLPLLSLGALTGSLVIIPDSAKSAFRLAANSRGISLSDIDMRPLAHAPDYLQLSVRDADRQRLTAAITDIFQSGDICCLVGTAALLGEGWDAPALNTLILASVIGSFVMSNQMRGRAIRTDPDRPEKVANIWHLATISPIDQLSRYSAGADFDTLSRRFTVFHGIGLDEDGMLSPHVTSGIQRMGLSSENTAPAIVPIHNQRMFQLTERRDEIAQLWQRAIAPISEGRFLRPVQEWKAPRQIVAAKFAIKLIGNKPRRLLSRYAMWLESRHMRRLTRAIFDSLLLEGVIHWAEPSPPIFHISITDTSCQVSTPTLSPRDQESLLNALDDFFNVLNNPRFLIQKGNRYYATPKLFGRRLATAERFSNCLRDRGFGRHRLIYTPSAEGQIDLLKAKKEQLLNQFEYRTEKRITWLEK